MTINDKLFFYFMILKEILINFNSKKYLLWVYIILDHFLPRHLPRHFKECGKEAKQYSD